MKITPIDIQQQKFARAFRGCNYKEVERFLELVAEELEQLIRENNTLKDELRRRENQILEFQEKEKTLKDTLITAQKMTSDIKRNAEKEAEIVISRAEMQAEKIINLANQRLARLIDNINEVKRQRVKLESSLRYVLDGHASLLDSMSDAEEQSVKPEDVVRVMK